MTSRSSFVSSFYLLFLFLTLCHAQTLSPFSSCNTFLSYFKKNALSRVGPYGLQRFSTIFYRNPKNYCGPGVIPYPASSNARAKTVSLASAESASSLPNTNQAGVDFSETNVQVQGVDEPDIVKTDGKRVFTVRGDTFFVVPVTKNGAAGSQPQKLKLPKYASEMLIQGDQILVIARDFGTLEDQTPVGPGPVSKSISPARLSRAIPFPGARQSITVLYQINVSNNVPKLISTLRMEGSYVSSREVNGIARIVMTFNPTRSFKFTFPSCEVTPEEATKKNKEVILKTGLQDWLPRYVLKKQGCKYCVSRGFTSSCNRIYTSKDSFSGFGLLSVVTIPLSGSIRPRGGVSISSDAQNVYSTATSLYVATTDYKNDFFGLESSPRSGPSFKTSLHKFALSNFGASYIASGYVFGSVLNQFSMHEYQGTFFVATTLGAPWWASRDTSSSKVTAFDANKAMRKLNQIGEVGNLGVGERIFAVRYIQSTAYVVTFRQIDPLYIIDLSKPTNLRVTGELKIPGFSSYLHPVAPGRILGVGREATDQGRTTGAKVTLFDVSDVTKPTELASWTLKGSYTSAQWDHRAFLYWKPESAAVLPLSVYDGKTNFAGSIVLDVADSGIKERGRIEHPVCCGRRYTPRIERNLVLGATHLWSLSSDLLQINDIKKLNVESSVALQK